MARRVAAVDGAVDRSAVVAARQRHDALELVRHRVDFLAFVSAAVVADAVLPTEDQRRNLHHSGRNTRTNAGIIVSEPPCDLPNRAILTDHRPAQKYACHVL